MTYREWYWTIFAIHRNFCPITSAGKKLALWHCTKCTFSHFTIPVVFLSFYPILFLVGKTAYWSLTYVWIYLSVNRNPNKNVISTVDLGPDDWQQCWYQKLLDLFGPIYNYKHWLAPSTGGPVILLVLIHSPPRETHCHLLWPGGPDHCGPAQPWSKTLVPIFSHLLSSPWSLASSCLLPRVGGGRRSF